MNFGVGATEAAQEESSPFLFGDDSLAFSTQNVTDRGGGCAPCVHRFILTSGETMPAMDYTAQKESAGALATITWIGAGLYLYLSTNGASLFSWSALGFFVVGMFGAAIVFGIATHVLQRGIAKLLVLFIKAPSRGIARTVTGIGWILFIAQIVVITLTANWVFHQIEPVRAALPAQYASDRDQLDAAMKAFYDANKLDQENLAGSDSAKVDPAKEAKLQVLIETGLEHGRKVSDDFLEYLDPELPQRYHAQLIHGHELLLQGRQTDNIAMQAAGIELLRQFYQEFMPTHGDAIFKKLD